MNKHALIQPAGKAFNYFGYKGRDAKAYPVPRYGHIIEPFAGGAGYALTYPDLQVTLYDLDESVCELWEYLIRASSKQIMNLPLIKPTQHIDDLKLHGIEKELIQRWLNPLSSSKASKIPPVKVKSSCSDDRVIDSAIWGDKRRYKLSILVERIKHWRVYNKSYEACHDTYATWFIDPPYASKVSNAYKCTHKAIDYDHLSIWCKSRKGQAMVCENTDSPDWLPFKKLHDIRGGNYVDGKIKRSTEVIWCSDERDWPMTQSSLL